jgi:hypothetical protein
MNNINVTDCQIRKMGGRFSALTSLHIISATTDDIIAHDDAIAYDGVIA